MSHPSELPVAQAGDNAGCRLRLPGSGDRSHNSDPRLRTHSNRIEWDQRGFVVQALREEGLNDTEIARALGTTPRTVKRRRARVTP